jgi:hypothetical protein
VAPPYHHPAPRPFVTSTSPPPFRFIQIIIPHISKIYLKHCYENILKKFATLVQLLTLKHEKPSIGYIL